MKPTTAHQLARWLLTQPDIPVTINGWGIHWGQGHFVAAGGTVMKDIRYIVQEGTNCWPRKHDTIYGEGSCIKLEYRPFAEVYAEDDQ